MNILTALQEAAAPGGKPGRITPAQVNLLRMVESGELGMSFSNLRESLGSDLFDEITLDAMHKRSMKGHRSIRGGDDWMPLAEIVSIPDFQAHNAIRSNAAYTGLEKIPESGRYKIRKPSDEKVSYTIDVYGGMEAFSMQAMANDNLNHLGKTAQRLGKAGQLQFLSFVFGDLIDDNPTMPYDSVALFHASHSNNLGASTPLNFANLSEAHKKISNQTGMEGEPLHLAPEYLIVHPDEEIIANELVGARQRIVGDQDTSASAQTFVSGVNFHEGRYKVIVSNYITSGRWYLACGSDMCDALEVGFFKGQRTPQIFRERDNSGFEFEYDAKRFKVRHVFGGATLDHRWIVRGNAA